METLNMQEIENVSGSLTPMQGAKITLGLMAMAVGSPIVIGVGAAALLSYAYIGWME